MKKLVIMVAMVMGLGITNMMAVNKTTHSKVQKIQSTLPQTEVIDITDVPTIVINGLNNTYQYSEIIKIEVTTYNNVDIYKFTLLDDKGAQEVVCFTPSGVEI